MTDLLSVPPGGYRYLPGVFQYSAGVTAAAGFELERARLRQPLPLEEGFQAVEAHLRGLGRPLAAFCACELRSPAPFTEDGFARFNRRYVRTLESWGVVQGDANPVARSNVCPVIDPPEAPSFQAFTYTVPAPPGTRASFQVAGSGEVPEGRTSYREHIVRRGDTSPDALREKARYVLTEMERRLSLMGARWADVTATQIYTAHDIFPFLGAEIVARGAAAAGVTWHLARPPIVEVEYEMDVRGIAREIVL